MHLTLSPKLPKPSPLDPETASQAPAGLQRLQTAPLRPGPTLGLAIPMGTRPEA